MFLEAFCWGNSHILFQILGKHVIESLFLLFEVRARKHVGTQDRLACKHARNIGTWAREKVSTQETLAREHVGTQDMLGRQHVSTQDTLAREHVTSQSILVCEHVST